MRSEVFVDAAKMIHEKEEDFSCTAVKSAGYQVAYYSTEEAKFYQRILLDGLPRPDLDKIANQISPTRMATEVHGSFDTICVGSKPCQRCLEYRVWLLLMFAGALAEGVDLE